MTILVFIAYLIGTPLVLLAGYLGGNFGSTHDVATHIFVGGYIGAIPLFMLAAGIDLIIYLKNR